MIEIALSLAVIGFALVAIIGVLPTGMEVQKQNRQETIINQDASVFFDAIRNGQRGLDDLTNYVTGITNYYAEYHFGQSAKPINPHIFIYTPAGSTVDGATTTPSLPLTNGFNIVGLLSTPKYILTNWPGKGLGFGMVSNYIVASVRSISGPASEKFPQTNQDVQSLALQYRLISEVIPYSSWDNDWTDYNAYRNSTNDFIWRSNYFTIANNLHVELNDVRLTFRWPVYPGGAIGNGRQVFRTMAGGSLQAVPLRNPPTPESTLYFLQPGNYVKAP